MTTQSIQIKNVNGYKSMVINNLDCDLRAAYNQARELGLSFYVKADGRLQMWGLFSVCEHLGINDVSKF